MNYIPGGAPLKNGSRHIILIFVIAAIVLAGCADAASQPAPATVAADASETAAAIETEAALAHTAWQAEYFGEPADGLPVIPDTYPSLHFMLDRYSGYSSCNWFLGVFYLDGAELTLETPSITEGGCEAEALVEQGSSFVGSLEIIERYELVDDKLYLYTPDDQLMLTMTPLESLPFEGTTWEMKFFSTSPAYWQPPIQDTLITATFDGEQMTGNAGCNDYSAAYTRNEARFSIDEISVTEKTCSEPDGVMEQEDVYLSMLADAGMLVESERSIELLDADGTPMLLYHGR